MVNFSQIRLYNLSYFRESVIIYVSDNINKKLILLQVTSVTTYKNVSDWLHTKLIIIIELFLTSIEHT